MKQRMASPGQAPVRATGATLRRTAPAKTTGFTRRIDAVPPTATARRATAVARDARGRPTARAAGAHLSLLLTTALLAAGCASLPVDVPGGTLPDQALTGDWHGATPTSRSAADADVAAAPADPATPPAAATPDADTTPAALADAGGAPAGVDPDAAWWTLFGDATLSDLVRTGLAANQDVAIAVARLREAAAGIRAARSARLPAAGAELSAQRAEVSNQGAGAASNLAAAGLINDVNEFYNLGGDLRWEVDLFGRIAKAVEAARGDRAALAAELQGVRLTVAAAIASTYLRLRSLQEQRAVEQANVRISREQLELAQRRFATGLAPELDVLRAEGQLEASRARLPGIEAGIAASTFALARLLGQAPEALTQRLQTAAPQPQPPAVLPVGVRSDLLLRRPDVIAARAQAQAAAARLASARRVRFPQLVLTGAGGTDAASFLDLLEANSLTWLLGVATSLPIYQGGAIRADVDANEARLEAAVLAWDRTALTALEEAESALAAYTRARQERERLRAATRATAQAAEIAQRLYDTGLGDYLSALDARREDRNAQRALAQARERVNQRAVDLYRALGGGWSPPPSRAAANPPPEKTG